ncbi:uncharacterized protein BJ212DRAFT_1295829 [Suillus subaureus]|uniref:Uncharacterized protein n=1 Tax=Suillus subaureus TaxID=48587 RepID=A0A9P7JIU1_9AGAM|nr:uncharacterized protein BJ212DRAFT_1295829 [Suillus subaureus]KAG1824727.1 hypothetical protein BJ212DRAFT_1295829 [Suillus subaureus]
MSRLMNLPSSATSLRPALGAAIEFCKGSGDLQSLQHKEQQRGRLQWGEPQQQGMKSGVCLLGELQQQEIKSGVYLWGKLWQQGMKPWVHFEDVDEVALSCWESNEGFTVLYILLFCKPQNM